MKRSGSLQAAQSGWCAVLGELRWIPRGMPETRHVYYGKLEELAGDVAMWKEGLSRMHEALTKTSEGVNQNKV